MASYPGGYVMRRARAADRDAVGVLCARAWPHGLDYVPDTWDDWLADAQGELFVVEHNSGLAAVARVTLLAAHEGWLEGLRVDPGHRRRGLAGWILAVCLDRVRALGATVVRLGTGGSNLAVHKTVAREGMVRVAAFVRYAAAPLAEGEGLDRLAPPDLVEVRELLRDSPALRAAGGLYETSWCWPELTDERLAAAVAAGQAFGVHDGAGRLAGLALAQAEESAEEGEEFVVGLLAGREAALAGLARGLRAEAARAGVSQVGAKLPEWSPLRAAAEAAGFTREGESEVWVFEKRLM